MRISDWSSDVCSSDLLGLPAGPLRPHPTSHESPIRHPGESWDFVPPGSALSPEIPAFAGMTIAGSWPHRPQIATAPPHASRHPDPAPRYFRFPRLSGRDRKSVVSGKSVSVLVDLGVGRIIKKKKKQ